MDRASILIVEDEAVVALDVKLQLEALGYRVAGIAASAEEAIDAARRTHPNLILMDVRLRGPVDGISAAHAIRRQQDVPLVFLTSHSDDETVRRAAATAPYGYLTKPFQIKELRAGIEVALTKSQMERQLREADLWFAHTLRCVTDGVVVTNADSCIRFINPAAETLTGWQSDAAVGRGIDEVVRLRRGPDSPAGTADAAARVAQVLLEGRPASVAHALILVALDGSEVFVDETTGPVDDEAGNPLGAVMVLRDARPRLAQEALLRASEARFRNAFDHAPMGMALVSFAGDFLQVNDAMCRLLGLPRDELMRRSNDSLTPPSDREHETLRLYQLQQATDGVVQFEKRYVRGGGLAPICTLVSVSLLREGGAGAGGGDAVCYLYQVHDLTEQQHAAEHLAALADERIRRETSELLSAAKSEFLSRVSHEMRTPLNAVLGFAQLLQLQAPSPSPATVSLYAGHIHDAGDHLLKLVTDLLDLDSAAAGKLKLDTVPVALATVVREALRLVQGEASAHGIELDVELADGLYVLADAQRLRQVLLNLASNAIKYNRQGGRVQIRQALAGKDRAALTIVDHGIGMTPEQLERLFRPFERVGAERTTIPGTGLGLVIARSLINEMGGSLDIRSESRVGTTVTITLKVAPAPAPAPAAAAP